MSEVEFDNIISEALGKLKRIFEEENKSIERLASEIAERKLRDIEAVKRDIVKSFRY